MLSVAITVLMYVLLLAILFQKTAPRMVAACVFSILTLVHDILFAKFDFLLYYGTASANALLVAILLLSISPSTRLSLQLTWLCVISIAFNGFWYFWPWHIPDMVYEIFYIIFYTCALILMLRKGIDDSGKNRINIRVNNFLPNLRSLYRYLVKGQG